MKKSYLPKLSKDAHKSSHGTVAVVAGSPEYPGAAVLCVGGARRGGSGYINFVTADDFTRSLVLNAFPDTVTHRAERDVTADAWVIGSGSPELGRKFSINSTTYAVLDSGAMAMAKEINAKFVVITPHEGEARKLGFPIKESAEGRRAGALEMAKALNCVVVLKGNGTVVASPDGLVAVDELAGPELATAGTGDILAGLIGSMLAAWQPKDLKDVVVVVFKAISAHALAGRAAAAELNPITATDVLDYLPIILKQ